jgi:hypothetical protein
MVDLKLVMVLRDICLIIYLSMFVVIFFLLWLELKHPVTYKKLPKWLR